MDSSSRRGRAVVAFAIQEDCSVDRGLARETRKQTAARFSWTASKTSIDHALILSIDFRQAIPEA